MTISNNPKYEQSKFGPFVTASLFISLLLSSFVASTYLIFFPEVLDDPLLRRILHNEFNSLKIFGTPLIVLISGIIATRYGSWKIIGLGCATIGLGLLLVALSSPPSSLGLAGIALCIIGAAISSFNLILAALYVPDHPRKTIFFFGLATVCLHFGGTITTIITWFFMTFSSNYFLLIFFSCSFFIIFFILVRTCNQLKFSKGNLYSCHWRFWKLFGTAFENRSLRFLMLGYFAFHSALNSLNFQIGQHISDHNPSFFDELGREFFLSYILGSLFATIALGRWPLSRILALLSATTTAAALFFYFENTNTQFISWIYIFVQFALAASVTITFFAAAYLSPRIYCALVLCFFASIQFMSDFIFNITSALAHIALGGDGFAVELIAIAIFCLLGAIFYLLIAPQNTQWPAEARE